MRLAADMVIDNRFRIVRLIGAGGMGYVYLAQQLDLNRQVALKFMTPDGNSDEAFKRFRQEGKILSTVKHPNIVMVHCFGQWSDSFYIAMEYVDGKSLSDLVKQGPLPAARAMRLFEQTCEGLGCAHRHGIVHRDLKPSNILVTADDTVRIIDFGLAKSAFRDANQQLTEPGATVGTFFYMSPEQCLSSSVDQRSDIYALGCMLYYMLTGKPPFDDLNPAVVMNNHVNTPLPHLPNPSRDAQLKRLNTIIQKCTQKQPENRFQNIEAVLEAMRHGAIEELPNTAEQMSDSAKPVISKKKALALVCAVALLPILCFALFWQLRQEQPPAAMPTEDLSQIPLTRLRLRAQEKLQSGDYDAAIANAAEGVKRKQSQTELGTSYSLLWDCYRLARRNDQAIEIAKQYSQLPGVHGADGLARMAMTYADIGKYNDAVKMWQEVENRDRLNHTTYLMYYAVALRHVGNYELALAMAKAGLQRANETREKAASAKPLTELQWISTALAPPRGPGVSDTDVQTLQREIKTCLAALHREAEIATYLKEQP